MNWRTSIFAVAAFILGGPFLACGGDLPENVVHGDPVIYPHPSPHDLDADGIDDDEEQRLAETYAPMIFHHPREWAHPSNVDTFLEHTSLHFSDRTRRPFICGTAPLMLNSPKDLLGWLAHGYGSDWNHSDGTRSHCKKRTFYLDTVPERFRAGPTNSLQWTTYFHAYPNTNHGITISYWFFYEFNSGCWIFGDHGGDWESASIVLDSQNNPVCVALSGHTSIDYFPWSAVQLTNGMHPVFSSALNGHATVNRIIDGGIQQQTWSGGDVYWADHRVTKSGRLVNLGEKLHPMPGCEFVQYSGLWGRPGNYHFSMVSGFWGPAFNETAMGDDGFITAWGWGMATPAREDNGVKECFPTWTSP